MGNNQKPSQWLLSQPLRKKTVSRQFLLLVTDSKVFVSVRFPSLPAIEAGKLFPFPIDVMDNTKPQPHGTDVFNTHWNCPCKKCGPKREAIRRLIDSFSQISSTWIEELATLHGEFLPLPMWGTIFIPQDSADVSNIEKLLCEIKTDNEEEETFASAGWQEVGQTGIYAIEFDGELLLAIHGAGYDFYSQHWFKLYEALGYKWHE